MNDSPEITPLLQRAYDGDETAMDEVARLLHGDLVKVANKVMFGKYGAKAQGMTLEPTALVNETFIKLLQQRNEFQNREHFFAIATRIMLRVLMDYHKEKNRQKRGGDPIKVTLGALGDAGKVPPPITEVPDLLRALEQLEEMDPELAQVVKLKAMWGLNIAEVADVMGVSRSKVDRDWAFARRWLKTNLSGGED